MEEQNQTGNRDLWRMRPIDDTFMRPPTDFSISTPETLTDSEEEDEQVRTDIEKDGDKKQIQKFEIV